MPCHHRACFHVFLLAFSASVCAGRHWPIRCFNPAWPVSPKASTRMPRKLSAKVSELEPGKARGTIALAKSIWSKRMTKLSNYCRQGFRRPAPPDLHVAIGAVAMRVVNTIWPLRNSRRYWTPSTRLPKQPAIFYFRMAEAYHWISPSPRSSRPQKLPGRKYGHQ